MRDLVVLLPGITGSVLQKDNEDLWAVSGQSLWAALRDRKDRLEALKVPDHKPGETPPDDGIRATRLIWIFMGFSVSGKSTATTPWPGSSPTISK
jgi:hypothetical protein